MAGSCSPTAGAASPSPAAPRRGLAASAYPRLVQGAGASAGAAGTGWVARLLDVPAAARLHSRYAVAWASPIPFPTPSKLGISLSETRNLRDLSGVSLEQAVFLSSTGGGLLIFW